MTTPAASTDHDPGAPMTLAMPRVDASEPGLAERAVADRPDLTVEGRTALIIPVNDLGDKVHRWR
ncbi:MAG TPA: hypothetical protein IAA98_08140, partial [Candidatus Avipropionibacterium avicola]|nr:hypothetical protein [Candidatus Avipropionibacterium avicola]